MIQRHKDILSIISDGREATVSDLAGKLGVSQATVRQDLTRLEKAGFLRRVHGGAVLDETDDISHRMGINYDRKLKIARKAAEFVTEGETVFIESGSINALFAKEVSKISNVTIITTNAFIARQIGKDAAGKVILLGGIYQPESECMVGNMVKICLDSVNFSRAFIGIDGFTPTTGFTGRDMMRAELNNEIIRRSPETFILTDSSKFGKIAMSRYCGADDVEYLITDDSMPIEFEKVIAKSDVKILKVK